MREILFRGKRLDNGEWVEGYYSPLNLPLMGNAGHFIIEDGFRAVEVDPATVGQYTGLQDKNGKKIFEGDIMRFSAYGYDYVGEVTFANGSFCIACKPPRDSTRPYLDFAIDRYGAEKIGNRWDNQELLKEARHDN